MSSSRDDDPSNALYESIQKAKRQTVATACQYCRKKRTKCDGQRPCSECTRRQLECVYISKENETPQQAHKRKFDELSQSHDELKDLFKTLAGQDERRANEIFQGIRSGHRLESLLNLVRHGSIHQPVELTYDQRLRKAFLMMIVSSTASLHEVVSVASSVLNTKTRINLPPLDTYKTLRDTIITLETMSGVLADADARPAIEGDSSSRSSTFTRVDDGSYSGPAFWVPCEPWTTLTKSDEVVSELVSFFLTFCNPSWRMVEVDVFLRDMRSRQLDSQYCSPLLVHAILAWASLYSEREEVFATLDNYITRGEHFHNEALRLVTLEAGRESVTNMQALCILSVEISLRAQDRLGVQLVMSASAMNKNLPIQEVRADMSVAARTAARVRICAWSAVTHMQISYSLSLLKDKDWLPVSLKHAPDLTAILPETTTYWTGQPLIHQPKEFRPNTLLHQRNIFDRFNLEVVEIILSEDSRKRDFRELWPVVYDLIRRLLAWYDNLPVQIRYSKDMPVPQYEFHASYYCTCMVIYEQTHVALLGQMAESTTSDVDDQVEELIMHLRAKALAYAYKASNCVRDFREIYGLKVVQPFLLQNAVIGSFILLNDMKSTHPRTHHGSPPGSPRFGSPEDTRSGFEECFRLLVATGMQCMLSRGIARMVHQTARYLNVPLPDAVVQMNQAVAETSWHPSDVHQLRSSFPNWTLLRDGRKVTEEYQMADLLKKWEELGIREQQMIEESSSEGGAA